MCTNNDFVTKYVWQIYYDIYYKRLGLTLVGIVRENCRSISFMRLTWFSGIKAWYRLWLK